MAAVALAMILLLGVAIYSLSQLSQAPRTSLLRNPKIEAHAGRPLPAFKHIEGEKSLDSGFFQGRWTLVSFWSYGCIPCLEEIPALNQLALSWQETPDLNIITINVDESDATNIEQAKEFLSDQQISLPTYYDKNQVLKTAFQVDEIPHQFLVNPAGQIVWDAVGSFKWNTTDTKDQLLKVMATPSPGDQGTDSPDSPQDPTE